MLLSMFEIDEYINNIKSARRLYENIAQKININKKKILLFNLPVDSNLGDHAQSMCIINWIEKNYPDYDLYCFPVILAADGRVLDYIIERIKLRTTSDDIIVFHSGYHINDIYRSRYGTTSPTTMLQLSCLKVFKENRIVFFPQTINMKESNMIDYAKAINGCKSVFFMCRDSISYEVAKKYFVNIYLCVKPDIVTSLINNMNISQDEHSDIRVYIALRNPEHAESIITKNQREEIYNLLNDKQYYYSLGNTSVSENYKEIIDSRNKIITDKINEIASYDLVITDLYHGTIFSVIANTFVVVLRSGDHKVSSGVELLKGLPDWENRFKYCENHEQLINCINNYCKKENLRYFKEPIFEKEYYDCLKKEIEEYWESGGI